MLCCTACSDCSYVALPLCTLLSIQKKKRRRKMTKTIDAYPSVQTHTLHHSEQSVERPFAHSGATLLPAPVLPTYTTLPTATTTPLRSLQHRGAAAAVTAAAVTAAAVTAQLRWAFRFGQTTVSFWLCARLAPQPPFLSWCVHTQQRTQLLLVLLCV
jgi:hypothetical protein